MANQIYDTANGILSAAQECGLDKSTFRQLPGARAEKVIDQILVSFTKGGLANRGQYWLWNHLREPHASARWSGDVNLLLALGPGQTPVWLMVEDFAAKKRGHPFWLFETTLAAALTTLSNHHLLEFYLVSRAFDWLVGENHHDVLFGVGEPAVVALQGIASSVGGLR